MSALKPLQILLFDRWGNAFQHLVGRRVKLRGRLKGWRFLPEAAFEELAHYQGRTRGRLQIGSGTCSRSSLLRNGLWRFRRPIHSGRINLSPTCGIGGDAREAVFCGVWHTTPFNLILPNPNASDMTARGLRGMQIGNDEMCGMSSHPARSQRSNTARHSTR